MTNPIMIIDPRLASGELGDNALILGAWLFGIILSLYIIEWILIHFGKNKSQRRRDW